MGNPLYHWSHLELKRYFGYEGHLTGANAKSVWDHCQAVIGDGLHVRGILKQSNVTLVCTTDDPADTLEWHEKLAADPFLETKVLPAFRPDQGGEFGAGGLSRLPGASFRRRGDGDSRLAEPHRRPGPADGFFHRPRLRGGRPRPGQSLLPQLPGYRRWTPS